MLSAPFPANEQERLQELYQLEILDTPYEQEFDDLVQLASQICNVPISLISLIDTDRQWFKANVGLDSTGTDRSVSFCAHAILQNDVFIVDDAMQDDRFSDNPLVTGNPLIRFYAGIPLTTQAGYKLGTLCVIDTVPRDLSPEQQFAMKVLSGQVIKLFEARVKNKLLDQKQKQLRELTTTQTRIISIMAHDIRNPLGSLKSILHLMETGELDADEAHEMLALGGRQLDGTLEMLSNLVDWGSLQLNGHQAQKLPLHLHSLTESKLAKFQTAALLKNNELRNEVPLDFIVESDEYALRFVLRNLISNAMKFTENGTIRVSASRHGGRVQVCVSDSGTGIPEAVRLNLFDANRRQSTPGTKREKGSGLGLLLVREYLEKIGAQLELRSAPGVGTEAELVL